MKQERHELQFPNMPRNTEEKLVDLRIGNKPDTLAVDEKLCAELVDVEANPLGEVSLAGMSNAQKKRAKQLAFMLMMHTKNRTIQMITRQRDPVNGLEIWRRFLEEWEPVNRGRYRGMLMQLLQCPLTGSRSQALEEWERPVRQYEAQNLDTIKAAILEHNPQDSEWCRYVGLSATRLQGYNALKSEWKAIGSRLAHERQRERQAQRQRGKRKGKREEKARISRRKEHQTRRTRNAPSARKRIVPSP